MTTLNSGSARRLRGSVAVPGDKSISHRALILGALAVGRTRIAGLLEGEDVLATAAALRALGAGLERGGPGSWQVDGVGVGGLAEPDRVLDLGNAGTPTRLLMGVVATHPIVCFMTGDASLRARPMARVAEPIRRMGAEVVARAGTRLPLAVIGAAEPLPITYRLPVASAQVKSAVLLAGLNAPGRTTVLEPAPSRDHTELMLRHFGVEVEVEEAADGGRAITLAGYPEIAARAVEVPGDPSSAAFPAVAALLVPGAEVTLTGIGLNPTRTGLFECLEEMGAGAVVANRRVEAGEPVGDVTFRAPARGRLRAIEVPAGRAPRMIDEYPILAVAAAFAEGTTRMHGLAELRVKESDRLAAIARGLAACGAVAAVDGDTLAVTGDGRPPPGGATVDAGLDHRIAMAFLVLGLAARAPVAVAGAEAIETSFPGFVGLMNGLGAAIAEADDGR